MLKRFLGPSLLLIGCLRALSQAPGESPEQFAQRMKWFNEARFGMFIHWGLYAVLGGQYQGKDVPSAGEWIMETAKIPVSEYEQLVPHFDPVKYNARQWVRLARRAGMKYIVITSKHHDGFALWDSQVSDYDIMATPFQRDALKELADACADADVRLCFYHSIMDWHHPDWGTRRAWFDKPAGPPDMDRFGVYLKAQLKELLTGYGPLGILWFDGEWESPWTHQRGVDLYNYVRSFQPDIIINNRVGKGRAGMQGMDQGDQRVGDYGTPEQEIPATGFGPGVYWESCMTMNDTWGFKKNDHNWKSATVLVRNLIDCASKGGNYLLNVGPTPEGAIPEASVERLAEIGRWMRINGEAIYATSASPFKKLPWGRCTQKAGKLYLHVFDWPSDGRLSVPLTSEVKKAYLLARRGRNLAVERADDGVVVHVPATSPTPHAGVVVLEIEGDPAVVEARLRQAPDGTLTLNAADADLIGHTIKLETEGGVPNIGYWTDANDRVEWPVTITRPGLFDVEATWACDPGSAGAVCALAVGDQQLTCTVEPTQGWDVFDTGVAGQIEIHRTGPTMVVLKALSKPGAGVVNLRQVRLIPGR